MTNQPILQRLEKKLGVSFKDKDLLTQIFVHRSYLNEHPDFALGHNERLEFLGDAVLELVVTEALYKQFDNPEGELTSFRSALVRGEQLAKISNELGFADYLFLSRGEAQSGGRSKQLILANVFEAFIGALYLDQGYQESEKFIKKHLLVHIDEIVTKRLFIDPKSRFQELAQESRGVTPTYKVLSEEGPDHKKAFVVGAFIGKEKVGEGTGSSKQAAQTAAAQAALDSWPQTKAG